MAYLNNTALYDLIVSRFLYGSDKPPTNLIDEALIRPEGVGSAVEVDTASYMSGPGRFATANRFELTKAFFTADENVLGIPRGGSISLADLQNRLGQDAVRGSSFTW